MSILLACDFNALEWARWRSALAAAMPGERFVLHRDHPACINDPIDVAIVANPAPGALSGLSGQTGLRLVQSLWAGVDRLLADPTLPADVPLARMVDPAMSAAMAETALWAVLALHRGFFRYARLQREQRWAPHTQRRADEVCVAVLGLGHMGRATAERIAAQGYRTLGWVRDPQRADTEARRAAGSQARSAAMTSAFMAALTTDAITVSAADPVQRFAGAEALAGVLSEADVVVNLLPLTPLTQGLFDARRFAQMKRGAGFVNLARGAHVVEDDLLAALDAGQLRDAVLDVFQTEPLPSAHALWSHPRVTVLPHAAAQTDPRTAARVCAINIKAARSGEAIAHRVDRQRGY